MHIVYEAFPRLSTLPEAAREQFALPSPWAVTNATLVLENNTTDVIVVAHNGTTRTGAVGHFGELMSSADHPDEPCTGQIELRKLLERVNDESRFGPHHATSLWIGGAALHGAAHPEGIVADRHHAERKASVFGKDVTVQWAPEGEDFTHVRLDAASGLLMVEFSAGPEDPAGANPLPTAPISRAA